MNLDNPESWLQTDGRIFLRGNAVDYATMFAARAGLTEGKVAYLATPIPTITNDGYLLIQERGVVINQKGEVGKGLMIGEGKLMTNTGVLDFVAEGIRDPFALNARKEVLEEVGYMPRQVDVIGVFQVKEGIAPGNKVVVAVRVNTSLVQILAKNREAQNVYMGVCPDGKTSHKKAVEALRVRGLPVDAHEGRLFGIALTRDGIKELLEDSRPKLSLLEPTLEVLAKTQF